MFYGDIDRDALYHKVVRPEFYSLRLNPVPATIFYHFITGSGSHQRDLAPPVVPRLGGHDSLVGINYTEAVLVAMLNTGLVRLPLVFTVFMWAGSGSS